MDCRQEVKGGECATNTAGNCMYSTATTVNTTDGSGSLQSFCAKIPPGQCIEENFPGHHRPELCLESNHRQEMVPHWKRVGHWIYTRASQGWRQGFSDMERAVQIARFELWRLILWSTLALDSFTLDFFRLLCAKGCEAKNQVYTLCKDHGVGIEASSMVLETELCCATATILRKSMVTWFRSSASSSLVAPRCRVLRDLGSPVWAWTWKLEPPTTRTGRNWKQDVKEVILTAKSVGAVVAKDGKDVAI